MKSILILTYDYIPTPSPNSYRWSCISEYWARNSCKIIVMSSWIPGLPRYERLKGVEIFRVGGNYSQKIRLSLPSQNNKTILKKHYARQILKYIWSKVYWPDHACLWFFPAFLKSYKLIKKMEIQNVITVSWPFTSNIIGYLLKKIFPSIFWQLDIIDPFSFHKSINNHKLYKGLNKIVEIKVFQQADEIFVLTHALRNKYSGYFKSYVKEIKIAPNVLSVKNINIDITKPSLIKNIVFIGTINKNVRRPDNLFNIFNLLLKSYSNYDLRLHLYGGGDYDTTTYEKYSTLMNTKIFIHGIIDRDNACKKMAEAHYLVNLGNNNNYQEPSKVIEYMSMMKPIINIVSSEEDLSINLLNRYPAKININVHSKYLIKELIEFIENPPPINKEQVEEIINRYRVEAVAEKFLQLNCLRNE